MLKDAKFTVLSHSQHFGQCKLRSSSSDFFWNFELNPESSIFMLGFLKFCSMLFVYTFFPCLFLEMCLHVTFTYIYRSVKSMIIFSIFSTLNLHILWGKEFDIRQSLSRYLQGVGRRNGTDTQWIYWGTQECVFYT